MHSRLAPVAYNDHTSRSTHVQLDVTGQLLLLLLKTSFTLREMICACE